MAQIPFKKVRIDEEDVVSGVLSEPPERCTAEVLNKFLSARRIPAAGLRKADLVKLAEDVVRNKIGVTVDADKDGPSQLINGLVTLPDLPDCPTYSRDVTPPKPICGICKAIGSNKLSLVWHVGRQIPAVRIKFYEIWMCKEPYEEWEKYGDMVNGKIPALTPPMSCTLINVGYGISHFTVRAIDSEGRFGPFAVPASLLRRSNKGTAGTTGCKQG